MNQTRKEGSTGKNSKNQKKKFIMLPTVDFCFKELMQNEKVRKGLIAAVMRLDPKEIESTTLMPTILLKRHKDDKYGILDVRVKLKDGTQMNYEMQVEYYAYWGNRSTYYMTRMYTDQISSGEEYDALQKCVQVSILDFKLFDDERCYRKIMLCDVESGEIYSDRMEMHVLELPKLPPEDRNEIGLYRWMRFLGGKNEEDLKRMAEKDEYIGEAYELIKKLSADEKKRIAYEYREKAIRDHRSMMKSARETGEREGFEKGEKVGREALLTEMVKKKLSRGQSIEQIAEDLVEDIDVIRKIVEEMK